MFHCPKHPDAYCKDKEGKTCVLCVEVERRFERDQSKNKRMIREAQVAAALAARAGTLAAKKARWDDRLPTVNKLAKTAANKAQQDLKTINAQIKAEEAWKGSKRGNLANVQQAKEDKPKARLRVQRGK